MVKNPAVTEEVLKSVYSWMMEGTIREDIILKKLYRAGIYINTGPKVVKTILVDEGFKLLQFVGKLETTLEKLRSILSQLLYRYEILEWEKKGVPLCTQLYVPEVQTHMFKVYYLVSYSMGLIHNNCQCFYSSVLVRA